MKWVGWVFLVAIVLGGLSIASYVIGYAGRVATEVDQQIDPHALQLKYEWFKDASAQLDKKLADIQLYAHKNNRCKNVMPSERVAYEQCGVWEQEYLGVVSSYNQLAGEYNSEMSKWNWRFTNVGELPQGATAPLPREYKPYMTQ